MIDVSAREASQQPRHCFGCSKELSGSQSKFCSRACLGTWKSVTYKGRKLTPEWKERQNAAKRDEAWIKHGEYVCEVCQRTFETNTGLRSHRSYCNNVSEQRDVKCEICDRVFKRARSLKMHVTLKHDPERNAKHRAAVVDGVKDRETQKTSMAEVSYLAYLKQIFDDVVHKFHIEGVAHEYDFYVPSRNLIIEYDGDYWHGNPKTQGTLSLNMKKQFYIDVANTKAALQRGFSIHRVWETEAHLYPTVVRDLECRS